MARVVEKSLVLASLVILSCLYGRAQTDQFLPEVDTYFKVNSDLRISFQAKQTRESSDPTQAELGPSLDFYLKPLLRLKDVTTFDLDDSKSRPLVFSIGYRYLPQANGSPATNRMEPVLTFRFPAKRFCLPTGTVATLTGKVETLRGVIATALRSKSH
jgi:hypothetical protein